MSITAFVAHYKSEHTRELHARNLNGYFQWLESEEVSITDSGASEITRYLSTLRSRLKETSVDTVLKSIRAYHKWLVEQGVTSHNPASRMRSSVPRTQPPRFVQPDDIRKMLAAALNDRDRAFIAILAFGSLSVVELTGCDVSDMEFENGRYVLHFKPRAATKRRPPFISLTAEVASLVQSQLNGRREGPLFLGHQNKERLSRQGMSSIVRRTAVRARVPYPVSAQMLAYSLPAIAFQRGYSYRGVARAMGIPERRHASRWLGVVSDPSEDNASIRLARFVMNPPDTSESMLMHNEALVHETDIPEPFGVMAAGAILERHLRLLGTGNGVPVKEDVSKGSITYYVGELQKKGVVKLPDARKMRALGDLRNDAAHGWFERIHVGDAIRTLRDVRSLVEKYPLAAAPCKVTQ